MSAEPFDMVVIGSGPAGEKAATQAAYFGKRVAIVERRVSPGGTAVSDAGIPTKTLRETAVYLTGFRHREIYGIGLALDARLKLERLLGRTGEVRTLMTGVVQANLERMGVEFVHGVGRLGTSTSTSTSTGRHRVLVTTETGERVLDTDVVLLAPGSRPFHPPNIPFDDAAVTDSEGILGLSRLPGSLVVVGGGAVGCEYASIFRALGVEVTLLEAAPHLLGFVDVEIADLLAETFRAQGTRVMLGCGVVAIERTPRGLEVRLAGGETLTPDHVLWAGGRVGNLEGLGLDDAGVVVDAKGRIQVDGDYQTSVPGIFAAGDVIGPPALASVSMEQGRVAACHAFGIPFKDVVDPLAPFGVYAVPEVAMVGVTEAAARAAGIDVEVGRGRFARNTRARIAGATEGLIKLVFRRSDRVLLGVHILGDIAAELVHLGQLIVSAGRPIDYFIHATFNVPTYSEAYKYAAYDGLQRLAQPVAP
ncbi:MAG: Si-specific NAD(P)(+) transhydrogenase [Deltaproteobacteria bacterium]|nr:Si-specific NAD(P)(+) transhydrogenase [Deltaproteobacteria bacterium]